jgi:hypothetical protein
VAGGIDRCHDGPLDIGVLFPGVEIAVDPGLRGPDGEPGSADPVRFGASDMASFAPEGTGTAGTVYVRLAMGQQLAVRVRTTGRTRILQDDPGAAAWRTS